MWRTSLVSLFPPKSLYRQQKNLSNSFSAVQSIWTQTSFWHVMSKRKYSNESKSKTSVNLALCQIDVGSDKNINMKTAKESVIQAANDGAEIVVLPECWNSPYATTSFPIYAETIPSSIAEGTHENNPSTMLLSEIAKEKKIWLIGGSIPEKDVDDHVFNTCVVFNPDGEIVTKHRKMHLFDIDVPGKITFKESDTLSAGNQITTFDTPYGCIGIGICYDIRFPELGLLMRQKGADIFIYPGAFNLTTGPMHWELLQRARAVDNQVYVAMASPARGPEGGYQAWGHSSIFSPWGKVVATTDHTSSIVHGTLDLEEVKEMRRNIPTSHQKRKDIYEITDCTS